MSGFLRDALRSRACKVVGMMEKLRSSARAKYTDKRVQVRRSSAVGPAVTPAVAGVLTHSPLGPQRPENGEEEKIEDYVGS